MRFGIMAMQMDQLIPSALSPQELAAYITTFDHTALVQRLEREVRPYAFAV